MKTVLLVRCTVYTQKQGLRVLKQGISRDLIRSNDYEGIYLCVRIIYILIQDELDGSLLQLFGFSEMLPDLNTVDDGGDGLEANAGGRGDCDVFFFSETSE